MLVNVPEMKTVNPPKQFSAIGRDAKGFCFLCYGSDLLTLRGDLNKALSAFNVPKLIEIVTFIGQLPWVIVKGKREELEKIKKYLSTPKTDPGRWMYPGSKGEGWGEGRKAGLCRQTLKTLLVHPSVWLITPGCFGGRGGQGRLPTKRPTVRFSKASSSVRMRRYLKGASSNG